MSQYSRWPVLSGGGGGSGTVTSVAIASPNGSISVTGSPIHTAGTIDLEIVGAASTFAGFDSLGDFESIPNWNIDPDSGGASVQLALTPADTVGGTTINIENFSTTITPTNNLVNLNYQGMLISTSLNGPNDFANFTDLNLTVSANDAGDHGNIMALNSTLNLGDGTNVSTSENNIVCSYNINVNDQHTVNQATSIINGGINVSALGVVAGNATGINYNVNVDGLVGGVNLSNLTCSVNSNQGGGVGINGSNVGVNISGSLQNVNGFSFNGVFNSGGVVSGSTQSYIDNSHYLSGSGASGHSGLSTSPIFDSGCTISGGYTGISTNPTVAGGFTGAGSTGVAVNGVFSSGMNFFNGVSAAPQFNSGTAIANSITVFGDFSGMHSGATTNQYQSIQLNPNFSAGASLDYYTGMGVFPNFSTATINNDVTGIHINIGSPTVAGGVTGLSINVANATTGNPQGVVGIDCDARIGLNASTQLRAGQGFQIGNRVAIGFTVPPGSPVTGTDSLGNNFAGDLLTQDDIANGPIGLGFSSVGFVASFAVAATKTVDTINVFLPAASLVNPGFSTGGTITDYNVIRTFSPLASGGTASFTNMYGFKIDSLFGDFGQFGTNVWGLYLDTAGENYFKSSININTSTYKVSSAAIGLEINDKDILVNDSHYDSTQTTPPVAAIQASAGTGATASIAHATDTAGEVTINTGTLTVSTGAYVVVTFDKPYAVAPIVVLTPAGSVLSSDVYVTSTTNDFTINFAVAATPSSTYVINYMALQTQ